ncbi:hypothetical protein TRVA0_003S01860 [Trichomonascus vanleenenianus]|uniref:uncharacterized protein n=1 Tax=Trichomonascus vanleenenianus TaxID=2268995 RepID=UPI003ECB929D
MYGAPKPFWQGYDYMAEVLKVISLRDRLLELSDKAILGDENTEVPEDLKQFQQRYQRLVMEKKINRKRDKERFKAAYWHDGKFHLLSPEELREDEEYNHQLSEALNLDGLDQSVVAPVGGMLASAPYGSSDNSKEADSGYAILARPPPPPSSSLPYGDDYYEPPPPSLPNASAQLPTTASFPPVLADQTSARVNLNPLYSDYSPNLPEAQSLMSVQSLPPSLPQSEYKPPVFNKSLYLQQKNQQAVPEHSMIYSDEQPVPMIPPTRSGYIESASLPAKPGTRRQPPPY